jgi:hypothetical protein
MTLSDATSAASEARSSAPQEVNFFFKGISLSRKVLAKGVCAVTLGDLGIGRCAEYFVRTSPPAHFL